ncbi:ABC transporter permease, partial [Escherichia coli]|uniref:ABC transporter permease n=2 Tax=Bacteria TaxID=2 RepID=UPI00138532F2
SSGVQIVAADDENNTFEGSGGAPSTVQAYYPEDQQVGAATPIVEGRAPHGAEEVVVNQSAAERMGIEVGDRISLIDPSKPTKVTVVGIYRLDMEAGGFFGALMEVDSFLSTFRSGGVVDELLMTSAQDESAEAFVEYL